jgi:thioesterase domain-containing protein
MKPQALEQYLHDHIPLSKAMQVSVLEAGQDRVIVSAPLAPNINHTGSVFGGSASAVATLAAWSLVHVRLKSSGIANGIVIQNNTMSYERPIHGTFTARSFIKQPEAWDVFMRTLLRRGRARIEVSAILDYEGQPVGGFEGNFVAIVKEPGIR